MIYAAFATRTIPPPPERTFPSFLSFLSVCILRLRLIVFLLSGASLPTQSLRYQMSAWKRAERKSLLYDLKMKAAFDSSCDTRCQWGGNNRMLATQLRERVRFSHWIPQEKQIILTALVPYTAQEGLRQASKSACAHTLRALMPRSSPLPSGSGGGGVKLHWQL